MCLLLSLSRLYGYPPKCCLDSSPNRVGLEPTVGKIYHEPWVFKDTLLPWGQ